MATVIAAAVLLASIITKTPHTPPRTLRVDYYHTGNVTQESFALDQVTIEPTAWPGRLGTGEDILQLGSYGFDVHDKVSGVLLHSRGFGSIYDEWLSTDEAARVTRTFHESLRFPAPAGVVEVSVRKREPDNSWKRVWALSIDPQDTSISTAAPAAAADEVITFERNGAPADKVDLLLLGDGYTASERPKFHADARRLLDVLFSTEPFRERRREFNVWGFVPAARESGISRPSLGVHRSNPVGTTYDALGAERYILSFDNRAFRRLASYAPYDVVEIVVNSQTYGGGGIYNLYSTVAVDNRFAPYLFVHEFAHHLAALADEYYTSPVVYLPAATRREPWEPNVTALVDPAALKWKDLVAPGTPVPTPWNKDGYETRSRRTEAERVRLRRDRRPEAEMEALFATERAEDGAQLARELHIGKVGAFEGARYEARGYYRPEVDCIMFTRTSSFCAVCRRAINAAIDSHTR